MMLSTLGDADDTVIFSCSIETACQWLAAYEVYKRVCDKASNEEACEVHFAVDKSDIWSSSDAAGNRIDIVMSRVYCQVEVVDKFIEQLKKLPPSKIWYVEWDEVLYQRLYVIPTSEFAAEPAVPIYYLTDDDIGPQ